MNIELWYDAVAQETDICINGIPVEKNDAYGFLYPVRNYPIQSWLYPIGSWKGIENQFMDLSRDEKIDLIFHGRECDYIDVEKCLSTNSNISLSFDEWDVCKKYEALLSGLVRTLENSHSALKDLCSTLQLKHEYSMNAYVIDKISDWAYHIYNDSDLAKADEMHNNRCYYVHESFFTSYDKLQDLIPLTRSLRIPSDAIYCCFRDEQTKNNYQYYAQSFKRIAFNFCLEDSHYKEAAFAKYGHPFELKFKIKAYIENSKLLCSDYIKARKLTDYSFDELSKSIVSHNHEEKKLFEKMKQLRLNTDIFTMGIKRVNEYTDILFSFSKNDKNEALHYECIDKLEEIIKLYLNPESIKGGD